MTREAFLTVRVRTRPFHVSIECTWRVEEGWYHIERSGRGRLLTVSFLSVVIIPLWTRVRKKQSQPTKPGLSVGLEIHVAKVLLVAVIGGKFDMEDTPTTDASNNAMILPGELLSTVLSHPVKLGPGLRLTGFNADDPLIHATQAGILHKTKHSEFYVDYLSRRVSLPFRPSNL